MLRQHQLRRDGPAPQLGHAAEAIGQSGRADLTVMTSGDPLTAAQVAQIRDVVLSKSSVTAQNTTVVEVK